MMEPMDTTLAFTAIRGIQAGREYYVAMCPLKVVSRAFLFDGQDLPTDLRAQRTLNRSRIPEMARYLVENPRDYIFSSITASIDGKVAFESFGREGTATNIGRLVIPMASRFLVNDGQHRRAAIAEALKERPELGEETLSVVFFIDAGLKRSQQMFADLNRHAVRPTKSLAILYDHRDSLSGLVRTVVAEVTAFRYLTETERTNVSPRSNKLYTLSGIYQATEAFLGKRKRSKVTSADVTRAIEFWREVEKVIPDWQLAAERKVSCAELRRDYIHAPRLMTFAEVEQLLKTLLERYGPPRKSQHPEYPFWRLQTDGIWEVPNSDSLTRRKSNSDPLKSELIRKGVEGGFTEPVFDMLKDDDRLFQDVVRSLLNGHFPPSMHQDLLDELSLGDLVSLRREPRDSSFRRLVVQAYEHRCAVCGYDIRIGSSALALEAAHIKWRQAGGPDQVSNGLALCAVHHKALDRGAFGITCDYDILISGELYGYAWA